MRRIPTFALSIVLASCSTPFAAGVNDYDFTQNQEKASVLFSDPQVYSRETLVNDRRIEIQFLNDQLKASEKATFAPQLKRDLQTLSTFVSQLDLNSDPAAGNQYSRDQQKADLQQQVDLLTAQKALVCANQALLIEQRRLEALQNNRAAPSQPTTPASDTQATLPTSCSAAPAGSSGGASQSSQQPATPDSLQAVRDALKSARALLDDLNKSASTHVASTEQTPQEQFRDRQTFREEIRAALADVNLDDGHDIDGNALYRLQFRATVLPGEHPGQFAIGRMTISPPQMTSAEVATLYFSWLSYINKEINRRAARDSFFEDDAQADTHRFAYELKMLGAYSGMFDTLDFKADTVGPIVAQIAMPPDVALYARRVIGCENEAPAALKNYLLSEAEGGAIKGEGRADCTTRETMIQVSTPKLLDDLRALGRPEGQSCPTVEEKEKLSAIESEYQKPVRYPSMVLAATSAAASGGVSASDPQNDRLIGVAKTFRAELDRALREAEAQAEDISDQVRNRFAGCAALNEVLAPFTQTFDTLYSERPDILIGAPLKLFKRAIANPDVGADAAGKITPRGQLEAFFARPIDQSQRVSTLQSASNAVDLALAMRSQISGGGIFGSFGANYVRQAAGRIDTVERSPIVVGFNDRTQPCVEARQSKRAGVSGASEAFCTVPTYPQAGWVFGPTLMPGSKGDTLERRQVVVNHSVSTDISIPGWWPRAGIKAETVWVGDWAAGIGGDPFDNSSNRRVATREFSVPLPKSAPDMLALTRLVSGLGRPLTSPEIIGVTPRHIVLCPGAGSLHVQVEGRNVWRGAEAFLNGVPASSSRVLPNMGGLDLEFPTANLPLRPAGTIGDDAENAVLIVWTRDSQARAGVSIARGVAGSNFCAKSDGPAAGAGADGSDGGAAGSDSMLFSQGWIAPSAKFALTLKDKSALVADRTDVRVEIQRYDAATKKVAGAPVPLASESGFQLSVDEKTGLLSFTTPAAIANLEDAGPSIITVIIKSRNGTETRTVSDKQLVYYAQAEQTSIDSGSISVPSGEFRFSQSITLPMKPNIRYPKIPAPETPLSSPVVTLGATIRNAGVTYSLVDSGVWTFDGYNAAGKPRYETTMKLATPGDAAALWAVLGKDGLSAQFILKIDGMQAGAPQIATIKQRP